MSPSAVSERPMRERSMSYCEMFSAVYDMPDRISLPPVPWLIWVAALFYAAAYTALFLLAAWLVFRRRALN